MTHFPAAQRRGNGYYFAASKDDCGCQLLQLRGNSSVICRTYSRHLHIWFDQQRGNMLGFPLCSWWFCSFRVKLQNVTVRRAGLGGGVYVFGLWCEQPLDVRITVDSDIVITSCFSNWSISLLKKVLFKVNWVRAPFDLWLGRGRH